MAQLVDPLRCRQCRQIICWLNTLDAPKVDIPNQQPKERPSLFEMAPPKRKRPSRDSGGSQANPSSVSPKKRKPSEGGDEDEHQVAPTATTRPEPRPLAPVPLRLHGLQQAPNTTSKATSEVSRTSRTSTKSRATSPVKQVVELEFLSKPVSFEAVGDGPAAQLTDDAARKLFSHVTRIVDWKTGFITGVARDIIRTEAPNGKDWPNHWFQEAGQDEDQEKETLAAQRQFEILSDIVSKAKISAERSRGEPAWNNLVHMPLLELAVRSVSGFPVICEPAMSAKIASTWLPGTAKEHDQKQDAVAAGRTVDFVLALDVQGRGFGEPLRDSVVEVVRREPKMTQSINQTIYGPLVLNPIGVSIETQRHASSQDGSVQLGVWTAAWHQRMENLLQSRVDTTTPLLLTTVTTGTCTLHAIGDTRSPSSAPFPLEAPTNLNQPTLSSPF